MADVNIVITIPSDKVDEFRIHFLLAEPKEEFKGTDLEWITYLLKAYCVAKYRRGKNKAAVIDYQDVIK